VFIPGLLGCFLFAAIAQRLRLRSFYFANGILGCLFTLTLVTLPHTSFTFALAVFGEYLFQAIAFSIQIGIVFQAIGPNNPLAATTFAFLTAATNVPITYLTAIDGHAYSMAGITGMLLTDAAIGIAACIAASILLGRFRSPHPEISSLVQTEIAREEV
jgi:MFS transporter, PAT family, beta-lactamase induction signal transducer AmpG